MFFLLKDVHAMKYNVSKTSYRMVLLNQNLN